MHHGLAALGCPARDPRFGEVAAHGAHPQRAQRRVVAARHADDVVPAGQQGPHDSPAEEAAAAGDEHPHGWPDAHTPSCGLSILELCRMSTGNDGG